MATKKEKQKTDIPEGTPEEVLEVPEQADLKSTDKYAQLKEDLQKVADQGLESYQETAEGRVIDFVGLRLLSKHGVFVKTGDNGTIEVIMSGSEFDKKTGEENKQKLEIGLNVEVSTKDKVTTSTNLMKRKNQMAKNFEVLSAAYSVVAKSIEEAQKKGTNLQREIDEEDKKWWSFKHQEGRVDSISLDNGEEININQIVKLVTIAQQEVTRKLGAKVQDVKVLFFKVTDSFVYSDTDGNLLDSSIPRVGFVIQVETTDGNTAFDSIRGVGNLEVLRRYTLHTEAEKSTEDIIRKLAHSVSVEALALDRAQSSSILGNEVPLIMSSDVVGVFVHEILGHPSEADIILENKRDKTAEVNLKGRIGGTVIENTDFDLVDTGEMDYQLGKYKVKSAFGTIPFDDHGTGSKLTQIVKKGVFINPLTDRYTMNEIVDGLNDNVRTKIEEHGLSGNSRTPSYKNKTQVRMTNTYLLPNEGGPKSVEEMAREIPKNKKGVYLVSSAGGWVNTESGEFCVKGNLGYLIENGIITDKPLKNVTMMGNISKIGNHIKLIGASSTVKSTFTGFCGKQASGEGETSWVPVEGGGPAIYLDGASIGAVSARGWAKICKEYLKQSSEINDGKRDMDSFHIEGVAENSLTHNNICMIAQYSVDDELKILTSGLKNLTSFIIKDGGKISSVDETYDYSS
jgi:TldD protein